MVGQRHKQQYLYHYTNQIGLIGILTTKSIWATHLFYLNDGSEFVYGKDQFYKYIREYFPIRFTNYTENTISEIEKWISFFDNPIFTISFSEDSKSLNQFRSYAKSKSGFSIGFDVNKLLDSFSYTKFQCRLEKCIYTEKEQNEFVKDIISICIKEKNIHNEIDDDFISFVAARIISSSPIIKHNSFSEEREWRLIFDYLNPVRDKYRFRIGESFIIPYLEIPIKLIEVLGEVIIGPTPNEELAVVSTKEIISNFGLFEKELEKKVYYSNIPYRNW